jgi:hypothetical protein
MGLFGSGSDDDGIATEWQCEPQGDYVTQPRIDKVKDILDGGENIHYLGRGGTIDVEGSSAGSSLFGDDRSRKSGTTGYVRTVVTDDRITVKIPQLTGNDERTVPYRNITSVDLDTGLLNKRLSLQTPGQTYHIQVTEPGKDEVREMVSFIREKMEEASQPDTTVVESEPDPVDQIDKLRELNEKGALSDEEFEEKKQELLDKI